LQIQLYHKSNYIVFASQLLKIKKYIVYTIILKKTNIYLKM